MLTRDVRDHDVQAAPVHAHRVDKGLERSTRRPHDGVQHRFRSVARVGQLWDAPDRKRSSEPTTAFSTSRTPAHPSQASTVR